MSNNTNAQKAVINYDKIISNNNGTYFKIPGYKSGWVGLNAIKMDNTLNKSALNKGIQNAKTRKVAELAKGSTNGSANGSANKTKVNTAANKVQTVVPAQAVVTQINNTPALTLETVEAETVANVNGKLANEVKEEKANVNEKPANGTLKNGNLKNEKPANANPTNENLKNVKPANANPTNENLKNVKPANANPTNENLKNVKPANRNLKNVKPANSVNEVKEEKEEKANGNLKNVKPATTPLDPSSSSTIPKNNKTNASNGQSKNYYSVTENDNGKLCTIVYKTLDEAKQANPGKSIVHIIYANGHYTKGPDSTNAAVTKGGRTRRSKKVQRKSKTQRKYKSKRK